MSRRYRLPRFNDQILSEIIFGMENQDVEYMLDISTGTLYSPEFSDAEEPSEENLIDLPPWRSSDGYQIMVAFTNSCQDHELKKKLVNELNSKERGVFRRFRDVLATEPEVLKQWYDFKDHRMKSYIKGWYREHFSSDAAVDELEEDELSEYEAYLETDSGMIPVAGDSFSSYGLHIERSYAKNQIKYIISAEAELMIEGEPLSPGNKAELFSGCHFLMGNRFFRFFIR